MEDVFSTTAGIETLFSLFVICFDNSLPFSKDVFNVSSSVKTPLADPSVVSFCFDWLGIKASIFSLNFVLLPDCEAKWIVGVQNPETQIQSHCIFSILLIFFLSSDILAISADLTFL